MDATGNTHVAGFTGGSFAGQTSAGVEDAFVRKFDPSGTELWTRQFGTADNDSATDVAVDGNGNVYVTGATQATFPGQTSSGGNDVFLQAFDSAGTPLWTTQFGTNGVVRAYDAAENAHSFVSEPVTIKNGADAKPDSFGAAVPVVRGPLIKMSSTSASVL